MKSLFVRLSSVVLAIALLAGTSSLITNTFASRDLGLKLGVNSVEWDAQIFGDEVEFKLMAPSHVEFYGAILDDICETEETNGNVFRASCVYEPQSVKDVNLNIPYRFSGEGSSDFELSYEFNSQKYTSGSGSLEATYVAPEGGDETTLSETGDSTGIFSVVNILIALVVIGLIAALLLFRKK